MSPLNTEQLFRELGDIKDGIDDVKRHLADLNGRTRTVEAKVFALWCIVGAVGAVVVAIIPLVKW